MRYGVDNMKHCFFNFSKVTIDRRLKLVGIISYQYSILLVPSHYFPITSGPHRKWLNKLKISYSFFFLDFSEMTEYIPLMFAWKMSLDMNLIRTIYFFENSLPVRKSCRFSVYKKTFCPAFFLETTIDRVTKFSGMIELYSYMCGTGFIFSSVISGQHRKW